MQIEAVIVCTLKLLFFLKYADEILNLPRKASSV